MGEDHLGGELYRTFPHELACLLHPIFAKAALRSCEPWMWRGSLVDELPKKGKDMKCCEAYRDIALTREAGKVYHGILLRTHLVPENWSFCSEAQYGGVRHRGCDFGNLAGRSFMQIAKARRCSGLWHVTRVRVTTQRMMHRWPMSREALHAPASEIMLQSLHLRRLLSDALSNAWAATQGVQEVAATRGEPLADLAFGMLMRRILQCVRDRMDDQGLVVRLPVCGATPSALADAVLPEMEPMWTPGRCSAASAARSAHAHSPT